MHPAESLDPLSERFGVVHNSYLRALAIPLHRFRVARGGVAVLVVDVVNVSHFLISFPLGDTIIPQPGRNVNTFLKKFLFFFRKEKSTRRRFLFALSCRPPSKGYSRRAELRRLRERGCGLVTAWLTLVYRTTGLRAVEDFVVVGLTDSLGVTTRSRLCPASLGCDNIIP